VSALVIPSPSAMPTPPLTIRLRHSPAFAAQSHGWCRLAPFSLDGDCLDWAVRLPRAGARRVSIRWSDRSDALRVAVPGRRIRESDREFLRSRVRWMFRADEDFSEFWDLCRGHGILRHCRTERTPSPTCSPVPPVRLNPVPGNQISYHE
jgi:hypothetical protein